MIYSSTVTSKGTITLPVSIRKALGITEGQQVDIQLKGDSIEVTPKGGWEEVMAVGKEIAQYARKQGIKGIDIPALRKKADQIKAAEYRKKYFEMGE